MTEKTSNDQLEWGCSVFASPTRICYISLLLHWEIKPIRCLNSNKIITFNKFNKDSEPREALNILLYEMGVASNTIFQVNASKSNYVKVTSIVQSIIPDDKKHF